ncbi:TetR/AcrR family transcriptional regulator [Arthrobacter sp. EpRS71]|uniref:TetR/AcrR family transcriptional regulator n=1 Tax=Arthrobacter sp. EpRS71 TaxID=1743141 RepID=UPI000748EBE7|nr:TetR/AcrR family transcriptional regulator [Arthrobacter sp. EpRS71]KUM40337.1 TetR family transcriptional regulator [Arthrobacter sp. EpRS71]
MSNSANIDGGLRERKRAATRTAITAVARSMTAAHGLNGFTVEEVCEAAGISRRTFFNYFHSKEDAVIGSFSDELPADALEEFNQNPSRTPDSISGSLLAALHVLTVTLMERSSISRTEVRQFIAAVTAEPQLLARLTLEGEARERQFAELVAAREGLQPDHPEVMTATVLFGAVSKKTAQQFFSEDNTRPYRGILEQNLSAARKLFAQPLATSHQLGPNPLETSKDPA